MGNKNSGGTGRMAVTVVLVLNIFMTGALGLYSVGRFRAMDDFTDNMGNISEKYTVYIGLNDKDSYRQAVSTEDGIRIVNEICTRYVDGYTMQTARGGWVDDEDKLTEENTLIYSFYGVTDEQISKIADDVLNELEQKSVMVAHRYEDSFYYYGGE